MTMKKNTLELVFILDRSGSMYNLVEDTLGGFNSMIEKQRAQEGEVLVTTVLFNQETMTIHDRIPIEEVETMTRKEYSASGSTALIDAMGETIDHIRQIHKYIRPEDVPEKTLFVITTDGMENASRKYTAQKIREKIAKMEKKHGWEFLFLGANIDAVQTAAHFGIRKERAVEYVCDSTGIEKNYETVSDAVLELRACGSINPQWAAPIQADYKKRKGVFRK